MADMNFDGDASKYAENDPMLNLPQNKRAFIEEVAYYANKEYSERKAAGQDWVLPSVCVAQACKESGYGEVTTVNVFGIKGEGTVARTSEEYTPGVHTSITDSFVSHGTIQEDVHLYYDLICGTGKYEGNDNYIKARNLDDPYKSIEEIRNAHYATASDYTPTTQAIIKDYDLTKYDKGMFKIEYDEAGYTQGMATYEQLKKILTDLKIELDNGEKKLESACNNKPKVDYKTIVEIKEMKETVDTLIDLLDRVQGIAEREKYVAEQYDEEGGSLDQFQAATLLAGTLNFSFNDLEDFKNLVSDFKKNSADKTFKEWFEGYVSEKGISSKVVNMSQYQQAIKDTGAVSSDDYVVSKVQFEMAKTKTEEETGAKETTNDTRSQTGNNSGNYTSTDSSSSSQFTSESSSNSSESTNTVKDDTNKDTETKEESSSSVKNEEITKTTEPTKEENTTTTPNEETTKSTPNGEKATEVLTNNESTQTETPKEETIVIQLPKVPNTSESSSYNNNNGNYNNVPIKGSSPSSVTPNPEPQQPTTPQPEPQQPDLPLDEPTTPNEPTNITRIPTSDTEVNQTSSSSGSTGLAVGLGIGAAAAAVAGGAYYMKNKEKKQDEFEEEYEVEDEYDVDNSEHLNDDISAPEPYSARPDKRQESPDYSELYTEEDDDDDDTSIPSYQPPSGNKFN